MKKNLLTTVLVVLMATFAKAQSGEPTSIVDLANPLQGTNSVYEFSTGNTYPAIATPWGMNFWTPQTRNNGNGWQYVYTDKTIQGFKQTHQPSPWINDYACFSLMPQKGTAIYDQNLRAQEFSHDNEIALPYYYSLVFDNGIKTEITPSNSGAIFKFNYPQGDGTLLIDCFNDDAQIEVDTKRGIVTGFSSFAAKHSKKTLPSNFATHFVIYFDSPITDYGVFKGEDKISGAKSAEGKDLAMYLSFGDKKDVTAKVISSFISTKQANVNYDRELKDYTFEQRKQLSHDEWEKEFQKVQVKGGSLEQKRTFYSALYRTLLFPRKTHEYNSKGEMVHYSFFTGEVEQGPMYADNGFWDTFRAVHPLFTIMQPSLTSEFMDALQNIYTEGGWLPEWFSPQYRQSMIGQNSTSIITDALAKGIGSFDKELMYEAMIKGANNKGPTSAGREGCEFYNEYGYIPNDVEVGQSVSRTLEYAYNDYCIARYAELIGKDKAAIDLYKDRSMNYKNVFDANINFVRPKLKDGSWEENYSPDMWGGGFTEGSAWHWTWCVFHDPKGLINLMGSEQAFIERMDEVFTAHPICNHVRKGWVIHEMTEMIAGGMGQYAHGNQPIQHMPYMYNYAGVPYKTQYHVRQIMDRLYSSGYSDGKGLCGDEDNGQTSAWYIFSAMGFYPVAPGTNEYIIGSPLFEELSVKLENGKTFTVKANNNSKENLYIQSAKLNGAPFNESFITHSQVIDGGVLEFEMGSEPNKNWAKDSRPFSLTK